jgi:hypothetical protein
MNKIRFSTEPLTVWFLRQHPNHPVLHFLDYNSTLVKPLKKVEKIPSSILFVRSSLYPCIVQPCNAGVDIVYRVLLVFTDETSPTDNSEYYFVCTPETDSLSCPQFNNKFAYQLCINGCNKATLNSKINRILSVLCFLVME